MTSLLLSNKEEKLHLNIIDEAMKLFGIDCTLFDLSSMTLYHDDRKLQDGVPYKLLLQDYVDTRLLSNLRWSTIDADKESIMAFMPIQYMNKRYNLREFNVIKICNGDTYQIREVNSQYLLNTWYIVKLIAYHDEKNRPREVKQMKTNFLHTTREEIE